MTLTRNRFISVPRRWASAMAVGVLLLAAGGCSEEPTEENSLVADLPLAGFVTKDTTIVATGGHAFRDYYAQDGSLNPLGRNGTYLSYVLLQFSPSSLPDRDTAAVFSARLRLRAVTWAGIAGAPFGFTVHRLTRSWSPYTFTWDSIGVDPITSGLCEATPRGTYAGTIGQDSGFVELSLDTMMVREWLQTSTTGTTTQFGVILIPTAQTQNAVRGFREFLEGDSLANLPTLTIVAGNAAGTVRDTSVFSTGLDTFVGTDTHPTGPADDLVMQGGVHFRSILTFDVAGIPRGAIINRATLTLEQNVTASRITKFITDPALATHLLQDTTDLRKLTSEDATAFGRPVSPGATTWAFNIRKGVQSWLRGPNYGLVIRVPAAQEFQSPDLYVFAGAQAANPSLRPRLSILYSVKSE